jgi:hypothetical protein
MRAFFEKPRKKGLEKSTLNSIKERKTRGLE